MATLCAALFLLGGVDLPEARLDFHELVFVLDLDPEMIESLPLGSRRDGEIDVRIVDHPRDVIALADRRRQSEQTGIEDDHPVEVVNDGLVEQRGELLRELAGTSGADSVQRTNSASPAARPGSCP